MFTPTFGYVPNPRATRELQEKQPAVYTSQLNDLKYDLDADCLLYRLMVRAYKKNPKLVTGDILISLNQLRLGSCVGFGASGSADVTAVCDVEIRKENEAIPFDDAGMQVRCSPDWCYGASRHIAKQLGSWQGSNGSWAVDALVKWGSAWQKLYGSLDLSSYSQERTLQWQKQGVPQSLIEAVAGNKFRSYVNVKEPEQAVALIQNGYGIMICGTTGWEAPRDEHGFVPVSGFWPHCQYIHSYVCYSLGKRKKRGFGVNNSWGDWKTRKSGGPVGSKTPDLPQGAYFAHYDDIARMLRGGDCWAIGGFDGFKRSNWDWGSGYGFGK